MNKPVITIQDLLIDHKVDIKHLKYLPLCHTRKISELINDIVESQKLKPKFDCKHNENILFFFYGKSQYIPKKDLGDINNFMLNPFTLIYRFDSIIDDKNSKVHRFYGFDSGGFEMYEYQCNKVQFEISSCKPSYIKKFVKTFYNSNDGYLNGNIHATFNARKYPFNVASQEYIDKVKTAANKKVTTHVDYGERAYTIEVQVVDKEIELSLSDIVVLPFDFLTTEGAEEFAKVFGDARIETYTNQSVFESYSNMRNVVSELIAQI